MLHTMSQKTVTIDTLKSSGNENVTAYPRLLKAGSYHFVKKLFSLMQRQIRVIQLVGLLTTIGIVTLLLLTDLAQSTQNTQETNIEPVASPKYATPKYAAIASRATASEIMPRDQMESTRREFDGRRRTVMRVCETLASKQSHLNATLMNMIVDKEHNVSWCPIYKAASSTWMNYFAVLKGTPTDITMDLVRRNVMQVSDIVRQKSQPDTDLNKMYERIRRSRKFLIVRHPLERLLSAYRDKLEHLQGREYYYKRFGRRIVLRYRNQSSNSTRLEPTFAEFLRFIANEKHFDEHWTPYYHACDPCAVHYDYILKFETLERDQTFFIQDTNLGGSLYDRNYLRNINPHGATSMATLREYIREVPRSLLKEVYEIYEADYKLFGYSFI